MKKLFFVFALCALVMGARAQEGNNNCVWAAMNSYNGGGGPDELEPAIKCSDEAIANEATSVKSKTWYYRGQLFTLLARDSVARKLHVTASVDAAAAFAKLRDLNDPKFKEWDDAANYILQLTYMLFNDGLRSYKDKNFPLAYKQFYSVKQMNEVLAAKTKRLPGIENSQVLGNAALSAKNAGDMDNAVKVYKEWIATGDSDAYVQYVYTLKKQGNMAEAKRVTNEGITKFPKDAILLTEKVNFLLADSDYAGALTFVNSLIQVDPKNLSLYLVKAQAFEKIGKPDSALVYYNKATEINPQDFRAWNNIGAYYINSAVPLVTQMNALGTSAEDNKKYTVLKAQVKEIFTKAKPYLEKAHELEPKDDEISRNLKRVESFLAE